MWFRLEHTEGVAVTNTGSRAGDIFGTTLFNLLMAAALRMIQAEMESIGIDIMIPMPKKRSRSCRRMSRCRTRRCHVLTAHMSTTRHS